MARAVPNGCIEYAKVKGNCPLDPNQWLVFSVRKNLELPADCSFLVAIWA
jgi:hypothetical protein